MKLEALRDLLRSFESCLVAYSGGVDSALLAYVAHDVLGEKALAAIADSPSLPRKELREALALAEQFQLPVETVSTDEFNNEEYLANPVNRCFFCKHELFTELEPLAIKRGFKVIAYGEKASDVGDHRPGAKAAAEFEVRAPLKEAGLSKADIRALSEQFGLPTASKPQLACLSSRIPYGERVTPQKLRMIEEAEDYLREHGFYEVRVRHHELGGFAGESGVNTSDSAPQAQHLARIELGADEIPRLLEHQTFGAAAAALKAIGYAHVTLDLAGYRRGSMNENVAEARPTLA